MTQKILSEQYTKSNLDLWLCDLTFNRVYLLCRSKTCPKQVTKWWKYIKWTTHWAQKSGLTCPLNMWPEINRDYLLTEGKPCTKFGIDQVKGSKDIKRTTQWAEKCGLTLTFEHVNWKSIGIIYSLRATPAPSLVLIKWRSKDIERTTLGLQTDLPTDIPTDSCKTIRPLFQGGHKKYVQ